MHKYGPWGEPSPPNTVHDVLKHRAQHQARAQYTKSISRSYRFACDTAYDTSHTIQNVTHALQSFRMRNTDVSHAIHDFFAYHTSHTCTYVTPAKRVCISLNYILVSLRKLTPPPKVWYRDAGGVSSPSGNGAN